jgi:uncharacterized protein (TIGR03067 family)
MFHVRISYPTVLGFLFILPPLANAEEIEFREFVSKERNYAIDLPGTPKEKITKSENYDRQEILMATGRVAYSVICVETKHGWNAEGPQETIKGFRSGLHRGPDVKIRDDEETSLGKEKVPGRAYLVVKSDALDTYVREQMFLHGKRLYVLSAACEFDEDRLDSEPVTRFFSSFRLLSAGASSAADAPQDDEVTREMSKLQGAWVLVSREVGGKKYAVDETTHELTFASGKLTFKTKNGSESSQPKLDPTQKPKAIEYDKLVDFENTQTVFGIYLLEGNTLTLCFNHRNETRPTEFSSLLKVKGTPESPLELMVFKRKP